mgnify:CR=1 FL=1
MFASGDMIAQFIPQLSVVLKTKDLSIQSVKEASSKTPVDIQRAINFGVFGAVMNGVALYSWYSLLERVVGASMIQGGVIARKIVADQLVYAPFSIICCFGYTSLMPCSPARLTSLPRPQSIGMSAGIPVPLPTMSEPVSVTGAPVSTGIEMPVMLMEEATWKSNFIDKIESSLVSTWVADCIVWPGVSFLNFRYLPLSFRPSFVGFVQVFWQSYLSYVSHKEQ